MLGCRVALLVSGRAICRNNSFGSYLEGYRGVGQGWHVSALPHISPVETSFKTVLGSAALPFAHRFAVEFQAIAVVNDAVQDAVGNGWIADLFVPVGNRNLRGQQQGPALVPIVTDLKEIAPFRVFKRRHGEIVQQQNVRAREFQEQAPEAAVGMCDSQLTE